MGKFAKLADVQSRLPYRRIEQTSSPSTVDVEQWVEEAESLLLAVMGAAGIAEPAAGSSAHPIIRSWVVDYAEGRIKAALAAAGGLESDSGEALIERFSARLDNITSNASKWGAIFGTVDSTDKHIKIRSNTTDSSEQVKQYDSEFAMDTDF